jgi:prevent-host-death family protein
MRQTGPDSSWRRWRFRYINRVRMGCGGDNWPAVDTAAGPRCRAGGVTGPVVYAGTPLRQGSAATMTVAATTVPISEAKAHLSELARRVRQQHERITLTRNGEAEAVLLSVDATVPDAVRTESCTGLTKTPTSCMSSTLTTVLTSTGRVARWPAWRASGFAER